MQHLNFSVLLDLCLWTLLVAAPVPFRTPSGKIKNSEFLSYASIGMCCAGLMGFSQKFCLGQQSLQPAVTRANENTLRMALRIPSVWCCPQCTGMSLSAGNDTVERQCRFLSSCKLSFRCQGWNSNLLFLIWMHSPFVVVDKFCTHKEVLYSACRLVRLKGNV